jgi:hypothetical protein
MTAINQWELHLRVVEFPHKTHIEVRNKWSSLAPEPLVVERRLALKEVLDLVLAQQVANRLEG